MEKNNDIEISILKGDKLFNENTPFVINLSCPEPEDDTKKSNADLICVIDISGSMDGIKIRHVKNSLKILLDLMDEKDRICLILFESEATNYFDLNYLTKENKKILNQKIDKIVTRGGTNIMSGLELAVKVIKNQCNKQNSASTVLLLSDGQDNFLDDMQIAESLKKLTKGLGLSFTLNTFGYGNDHNPKIMNKLANLRDGSFFYVEDYSKISEYFVAILGGCLSVISKKVNLNLQISNNNCQISRILGEDNLYDYHSNSKSFKTSMLQFICGKDYTFVLEIFVNNSKIQIGEELFKVEINYEDITQNNKSIKKEKKYNYNLQDLNYSKANEEYIRAYVYYTLNKVIKLKEENKMKEGKKLLEDLEKWLLNDYKGNNKDYIKDVGKAKGLFSDDNYIRNISYKISSELVNEKLFKNIGKTMSSCNKKQTMLLNSISNPRHNEKNNYSNFDKIPIEQNKYNKNITNSNNKVINYKSNENQNAPKNINVPRKVRDTQNVPKNINIPKRPIDIGLKDKISNISYNRENNQYKPINTEPKDSIHSLNDSRKLSNNPIIKEPKDNINNKSYNKGIIISNAINNDQKDNMNKTFNNKRDISSNIINIEKKDNKAYYRRRNILSNTNK